MRTKVIIWDINICIVIQIVLWPLKSLSCAFSIFFYITSAAAGVGAVDKSCIMDVVTSQRTVSYKKWSKTLT